MFRLRDSMISSGKTNADQSDGDLDGIGDACDDCPDDNENDADSDGVCGDVDQCPGYDDTIDTDGDGIAEGCDNCPSVPNDQEDIDGDGVGDACNDAEDPDGDEISNAIDNCDFVINLDQADTDNDGFTDGIEVMAGTDPTDVADVPVDLNPQDGVPDVLRGAVA